MNLLLLPMPCRDISASMPMSRTLWHILPQKKSICGDDWKKQKQVSTNTCRLSRKELSAWTHITIFAWSEANRRTMIWFFSIPESYWNTPTIRLQKRLLFFVPKYSSISNRLQTLWPAIKCWKRKQLMWNAASLLKPEYFVALFCWETTSKQFMLLPTCWQKPNLVRS